MPTPVPVRRVPKLLAPANLPQIPTQAPPILRLLAPEPVPSPNSEQAPRAPIRESAAEVLPVVRPAESVKNAGFGSVTLGEPEVKRQHPLQTGAFGAASATAPGRPSEAPLVQIGKLESISPEMKKPESRTLVASAGFGTAASASPSREKASSTPSTGGFGANLGDRAQTVPARRTSARGMGAFGSVEASEVKPAAAVQVVKSQFETVSAAPPGQRQQHQASDGRSSALVILSKPRPAYTDEARRLQIEGEVVLQASFCASGQVRILQVLRGLGHGLDETAARAAAAIRFQPAVEGGTPVDSVATVRIEFQLAY